jgi:hypothetical protein
MGALTTGFLYNEAVSPYALDAGRARGTFGTEVDVSAYFYSSQGRLGAAVVKFGARQFTALAADTTARIGHYEPLGVVYDNERCFSAQGTADAQGSKDGNGAAREQEKLPS